MPFLAVDSAALHYRYTAPPADRPLLVLAHSLGTDARLWDAVVADLGTDHGILCYDQRGHGLSGTGASPASMSDLADDLAALMDHLGITAAVLVGLSVGGMIVQRLAALRPDLVRALVLSDTAHRIGEPSGWAARIAAVRDGGIASIADATLERWFAPGFARRDEAARQGYRDMLCRQSPDGYVDVCRAIADADLEEAAGRLRLPVLCLVGDADASTPPALVKRLAELIPGARYAVIEGAGHLPCVERPEAFSDHVRRFVESTGRASAAEAPRVSDARARGMRVRRRVLGDAHVDRAEAARTAFETPFQAMIAETAWGRVWADDTLSLRERSLITLALLAALGQWDEFAMHVRATANTGASRDDVREALMHVAIYAGVPAANHAFGIARRTLDGPSGTGTSGGEPS